MMVAAIFHELLQHVFPYVLLLSFALTFFPLAVSVLGGLLLNLAIRFSGIL